MEITRYETGQRMSQIVVAGGFVFLAGRVAEDTSQDVQGQTQQILDQFEKLLAKAGTDKTRILSASIWMADATYFDAINEVWDGWIPQGHAPARACVESRLARPEFKVEIGMIAATKEA